MNPSTTLGLSQVWPAVAAKLDEVSPGWNLNAEGDAPVASADLADRAVIALHRLALAAETKELQLLKTHLQQEMASVRFVLSLEGLPDQAEKELRAHLMRMARLV